VSSDGPGRYGISLTGNKGAQKNLENSFDFE
jgi:hypothetical protein